MQYKAMLDFIQATEQQVSEGILEVTIPSFLAVRDIPWEEHFHGQLRPVVSDCGTKLLFVLPSDQTVYGFDPDLPPGNA